MSAVTAQLARRAIYEAHGRLKMGQDSSWDDVEVEISGWAAFTIALTVFFISFSLFAVKYTCGELFATLAAVEAPTVTAITRSSAEDQEEPYTDEPLISVTGKDNKTPIDQEILLVRQKPLTSRFVRIGRHLRARGGRFARFRGLHIQILESLFLNVIVGFFSTAGRFSGHIPLRTALEVLVLTSLTNLSLWWNHWVISEPSSKRWYQRMPSSLQVRKALLPTAIDAALQRFSTLAFFWIAFRLGAIPTSLTHQPQDTQSAIRHVLACTTAILVGLFVIFAIQIPSHIAITRVRASLLSEQETPIIPFDRSFNGQVVPIADGGRGMLGMWQAWAGAERQLRLRVLGVYLKTFAMQLSILVLGSVAILCELYLFLGPDFQKKLTLMATQAVVRLNGGPSM